MPLKMKKHGTAAATHAAKDRAESQATKRVRLAGEALARLAMEASPIPMAINDASGCITYLNPAFTYTFGYAPDELPTLEAWWPKAYPDVEYRRSVADTWRDRLAEATRTGEPFAPVEVTITCKDGTHRTVLASAAEIGGSPIGEHLVLLYDITERKKAEMRLRREELRNRVLANVLQHRSTSADEFLSFALREALALSGSACGCIFVYSRDRERFELSSCSGAAMQACIGELPTAGDGAPLPEPMREAIRQRRTIIHNEVRATNRAGMGVQAHSAGLGNCMTLPLFVDAGIVAIIGVANKEGAYDDTDAEQLHLLMGTCWKVVEQRRAEEERRESEERYRAVVDMSPDAILVHDEGRILFANASAARILGVATSRELVGKDALALLHPSYRDEARRRHEEMCASPCTLAPVEMACVRADGVRVEVETTGAPLMVAGRRVAMEVFRDLTEEKRAGGMRRLQGAALDAAANAIVITNREGVIEWVNKAFAALSGFPVGEAVGRTPGQLIKSGCHDLAFYQTMWSTLLRGEVWRGEMVNRSREGRRYTVECAITPLRDEHGRITHFIAVNQDITQRKLLEEQFRQSQKMESIGHLAGGVAHDFNNQLGVIIGHADLALSEADLSADLAESLTEIHQAAVRSADLTRQLLTFARQQEITPRVLDLNIQVGRSLKMLQRLIGTNIQIAWSPGEPLWPILMDPSQLDQILANLCVNARDAIADTGQIMMATDNRVLDAAWCAEHAEASPGDFVRLTVRDDGCGMTPDVMARIFEPFFTTKDIGAGTGLGLATVYGAVKQNKGFVTVASAPGEGTTFEIYLPRHDAGVTANEEPAAGWQAARGVETVLVTDDDAAMLRLLTQLLEKHGYVVLPAAGAEEAIRFADEHDGTIDLALTDVVMPRMSGYVLAERLSTRRPALKQLYMTGFAINTEKAKVGGRTIAKPFAPSDLLATVREVLDGD